MSCQSTNTVLLVSPDHFEFNAQTGETNTFQQRIEHENVARDAMNNFENLKATLKTADVNYLVMSSRDDVRTPDAVFPNNWFSVHLNHCNTTTLVLYPMLNENRQAERQTDKLVALLSAQNITVSETIDLTYFEQQSKALEGTGSLVLDRVNKIAYASISPRMNEQVLCVFCEKLGFSSVMFSSFSAPNSLIYHTNVMMSVGTGFAVLCDECITDKNELQMVLASLQATGHEVVLISLDQLNHMCGNILEVRSQLDGSAKIVMSDTAYDHFTADQRAVLHKYGELVHADIKTIETIGGGSVRCMLAEIFHE